MQLRIHPLKLELKRPFTIAHGTFHYREAVVVELASEQFSGFGEATAISYYGKDLSSFINVLEQYRTLIENTPLSTPIVYYHSLYPYLKDHPFLLCALDVAAHDLWAKRIGKPLYQAWDLSIDNLILTNYTIGMDSIEEMVAQIQELQLPIYKIKLGTDNDVAIIETLRKYTDAIFRIDANGAWSVAETLEKAFIFKDLGVEFIEQPLVPTDWVGMKTLFQQCVLPLVADESCQVSNDIKNCYQHFDAVNIKLMKCGGITPALKMITEARELGMKVMLGCMTESSIGISAIAHLVPLLDYVDMDGAMLLKNDPAEGVKIVNGEVFFREGNGIGASLRN